MSKDLRTKKPRELPGYCKLYEEFVDELTNQNAWFFLVAFFLGNAALSFSLIFINQAFQSKNLASNLKLLVDDLVFLLFGALVYGVGFGVLVGIITGLKNSNKDLRQLIARILISTPKPYKNGFGLCSDEINNLAEIAKIDQASSDWRGTFLTIAVWGVILGVLSKVSDYLTIPSIPFAPGGTANNPVFVSVSFGAIMIVLVIFALLFSWYVANYVGSYLGREPANRAVLNSCQEAKNILSDSGLATKKHLSISDKVSLGDQLGCKVISEKELRTFSYKKKYEFESKMESYWFLLIEPKAKPIAQASKQRLKAKIKIEPNADTELKDDKK